MRRLGPWISIGISLLAGFSRDNPLFQQCSVTDTCVADESGSSGDGDGAPGDGDGTPGDGDGTPGDGDGSPGDGDGSSGDGDGSPGDGDGVPGDGDGEPGDGDGAPGLPTCPNADWVEVALVEDTFLDASYPQEPGCAFDWDFNLDTPVITLESPCSQLDFGGAHGHWVCGALGCNSAWLGRFGLDPLIGVQAQVFEAGLEFSARVVSLGPNTATAYELPIDNVNFGNCGTWMAGDGNGTAPAECVTTQLYSAYPNLWGLALEAVPQQTPLSTANIPGFNLTTEYMFPMPIEAAVVQAWLDGEKPHTGVVLRSLAAERLQFYLHAQGSGHDPVLSIKLCVP